MYYLKITIATATGDLENTAHVTDEGGYVHPVEANFTGMTEGTPVGDLIAAVNAATGLDYAAISPAEPDPDAEPGRAFGFMIARRENNRGSACTVCKPVVNYRYAPGTGEYQPEGTP